MFFNTINENSYRKIYTTERPYTNLQHDSKYDLFLPTILSDLKQIVIHFTDSSKLAFKGTLMSSEIVAIHHTTRELCEKEGIIDNPSKWDYFVDQQLNLLKTGSSNLAIEQLLPAADLIKKAAYKEQEAYENDQTLFWRFDTNGHYMNIIMSIIGRYSEEKLSFSDSLFSGYIKDGMFSSDIECGIGNYSACTFSYCDINRQAKDAVKLGYVKTKYNGVIQNQDLPQAYAKYLAEVDKHELYVIKCDNELLQELQALEEIYIPSDVTISSACCFQSGEKFHPRISLTGEHNFESIIDIIELA